MKTIGLKLITMFLFATLISATSFGEGESTEPGVKTVSKETADEAFKRLQETAAALQKISATAKANAANKTLPNAEAYGVASTTADSLQASVQSCESAGQYARICLTEVSEHIQTAAGIIGTLLTQLKNSKDMSTANACKTQKDANDTARKALTAYNAACALAQARCASSCEGLKKQMESNKPKFSTATPDLTAPYENAILGTDPQRAICKGYMWNMAAAGMGIFSMLAESGKMSTCQEQTKVVDCKANPYDPSCATKMDCSKQENYQQTTCICQRTPTAAGCAGYAGNNIDMPAGGSNASTGTSAGSDKDSLVSGSSDSIPVVPVASNGSKGSSSLGGTGGGPSGGGGFGVGNGGAKTGGADAAKKDKGLNANILGGYDGGGGGGGGGGGRSTSSLPDSPYKNYLPGGKNDPKASVKLFGEGQVTGSGSKSNWEKVSDRYMDAKPTLVAP